MIGALCAGSDTSLEHARENAETFTCLFVPRSCCVCGWVTATDHVYRYAHPLDHSILESLVQP